MPRTILRTSVLLAVAPVLASCGDRPAAATGGAAAQAASETAPTRRLVPDSSAHDSMWFDRVRVIDAVGDGPIDTVRLRAVGQRSDSLAISLTVRHAGHEIHGEAWGSSYELIDPPEAVSRSAAARDTFMVLRLIEVLAAVRTEPLDTAGLTGPLAFSEDCIESPSSCILSDYWHARAREMAGDEPDSIRAIVERFRDTAADTAEVRAILDDIRLHSRRQVHLAYGYETGVLLVFSSRVGRMLTLAACC